MMASRFSMLLLLCFGATIIAIASASIREHPDADYIRELPETTSMFKTLNPTDAVALEEGTEMNPIPDVKVSAEEFEKANPIKVGSVVSRGPHWKWGVVDGKKHGKVVGEGVVPGWWRVRWDISGHENAYRYGQGIYDLTVTDSSTVSSVKTIGKVPKVAWLPDLNKPFAEKVALKDEPLVLTNTIAQLWPAMKKWTPEFIRSKFDKLTGVKTATRQQSGNTPFFYYHSSPMTEVPDIVKTYKRRAYTKTDMSSEEFFTLANSSSSNEAVSYAAKTDEWGAVYNVRSLSQHLISGIQELFPDIFPLDPFMVLSEDFRPEEEHLFRQTHVWVSPKDTVTPAHFDLFHNYYVMLQGRKRFLLIPPRAWELLYLYPIIHPGGRSSQVNLDGSAEEIKQFTHFKKDGLGALEVVLEPGDVLYIPPLWFHHVTAEELSVSVSVWSPAAAIEIAAEAVEGIPLPIKKSWTTRQKIAALRLFLESMPQALKMEMNVAEFVDWTLLQSRYAFIGTVGPNKYCWDEESFNSVILEAEDILKTTLRRVIDVFTRVASVGGLERRDILLADYFELTVTSIVGASDVKQFLTDLCYC